jgi:hypothetical protein
MMQFGRGNRTLIKRVGPVAWAGALDQGSARVFRRTGPKSCLAAMSTNALPRLDREGREEELHGRQYCDRPSPPENAMMQERRSGFRFRFV